MANKKYVLKNMSGGSLSYTVDGKLKMMHHPDKENLHTKEEIQDIWDDRGGRVLIEEDLLMILDSDLRKEIADLEPLDKYVLDSDGFKELFKKGIEDIEDFLMYCSNTMLERCVDEAVRQNIGDIGVVSLLKEYANQDISSLVAEKMEKDKKKSKKTQVTKTDENGKTKTARKKKSDKEQEQ